MKTSKPLKTSEAAGGLALAGVACVACCAAPIAGALASIGLTTGIVTKVFGAVALVIGAVVALVLVRRRRGRQHFVSQHACTTNDGRACSCDASSVPIVVSSRK
jgi:hypothetical protein